MKDNVRLAIFFVENIIQWSNEFLRIFPWRSNPNPYNIFICEFLLQRTKAEQVLPVYIQFIKRFSNFEQLKNAKREILKNFFNSIGLKKRLEYLMKCISIFSSSKKKIEEYSDEELLALPGVGSYFLNAFRCFAQKRSVCIIDSNVICIFIRFFNYIPKKKLVRNDKEIWQFAQKILPKLNYILYNYGLIDFGSLVCLASNPKCFKCPLSNECNYYQS